MRFQAPTSLARFHRPSESGFDLDVLSSGLLRRAHAIARHAGEDDVRSTKVDLRKARQRSVAILKRSGLDRTMGFAY
ncbi:hypothetical protein [Burkholderia vietnamiensis]|uniref:hypothetical protein n=1 Tax=Burkholderia vietnamiensis TaxID=60552 RepID=UPI001CF20D3B|nr:hypothetical protein [Burkholderia vietnamiensis]MCA8448859.1 hypothetical protein [Burkholderia vietnamiensis]